MDYMDEKVHLIHFLGRSCIFRAKSLIRSLLGAPPYGRPPSFGGFPVQNAPPGMAPPGVGEFFIVDNPHER